ncbi:hypothetical protein RQN30_08315 [Arcanobacterium hippocoleae]
MSNMMFCSAVNAPKVFEIDFTASVEGSILASVFVFAYHLKCNVSVRYIGSDGMGAAAAGVVVFLVAFFGFPGKAY